MASRFKLYNADGITLEYTFPLVQSTNAPQTPLRHVALNGVRGKGALIIPAGTSSWTLEIEGVLYIDGATEGYDELVALMDALEAAVALNTAYYLRLYKSDTTYYNYPVKRVSAIEYDQSLRTDSQRYRISLEVNSW